MPLEQLDRAGASYSPEVAYDDFPQPFSLYERELDYVPMPTALVRLYTPEGWVIAADGRKSNSKTGETWDNTKKIFPIIQPGRSLAYAITGDAQICDHTHKNIVFDFLSEAESVVNSLATSDAADDLIAFAEHVSKPIYDDLSKARASVAMEPFSESAIALDSPHPGFTIASMFFAGFYRGAPSAVRVRFFHRRQKLASPRVLFEKVRQGRQLEIYGSAIVGNLLNNTEDPRFAKWRAALPTELSIASAAEWAKNYISACASDAGRQADPQTCNAIGGHIHIATITPTDGFNWLIPPLDSTEITA